MRSVAFLTLPQQEYHESPSFSIKFIVCTETVFHMKSCETYGDFQQ